MIRFMTYNIRGTKGMDNRRSARRIAGVIRESAADIVCLQEVHQRLPWSRMVDQPGAISRYVAMRVAFQRNLSIGIGGYGNAILARMPIMAVESHFLTSQDEQRGALAVALQTADGPLTVFCTHLGLDGDERLRQARELAAIVNEAPAPKIVCGDLNEEASGPGVVELIQSAGLIDTSPGGTPTFDSAEPSSRIDFILHDPSITVRSLSVIQTLASDHLPVVADLTWSA